MGNPGILVNHVSHHLLEGQLPPEVPHIQMNVQLFVHGQAGGREPGDARETAHAENEFHGPGTVPVL